MQRLLAHVERDETPERPRIAHCVEQHPGLVRRARAELDERVGLRAPGDLRCARFEDRSLTSGRVVLRQPGDLVEERRTAVVVEPLRWEVLRDRGQAALHVLVDRAHEIISGAMSRAMRTPPNIQRLAGGKKLRYVTRL